MLARQEFSKEFKMHIVHQVETGKISKEEARHKYNIKGHSSILNWQREFSRERTELELKKKTTHMSKEELEDRVKELERVLSEERLRSRAYQIYIEEIEKEVGKPIIKKSGTVQLTGLSKRIDG